MKPAQLPLLLVLLGLFACLAETALAGITMSKTFTVDVLPEDDNDDDDLNLLYDCYFAENWCFSYDCWIFEWEVTTDRMVNIPIVSGHTYTISYINDWGSLVRSPVTFTATSSYILKHWEITYAEYLSCGPWDLPPIWLFVGMDHAVVQETFTSDSGDVNDDGVSDEYTEVILENGVWVGSDWHGEVTVPSQIGSFNASNLMINYRGQFKTIEQIAKMINKTVAQVMSVTVVGQKLEVIVKGAVIGQISQAGVDFVLRKLVP